MRQRLFTAVFLIAFVSVLAVPVKASLIGTTVTGGFFFNGSPDTVIANPDNQFNAINAGSGNTAVIGEPHTTGSLAGVVSPTFESIVNGEDFNMSADFSAAQLNIAFAPYRIAAIFNGFQLIFADPAFNGLDLSLLSFGGPFTSTSDFSYALSGDTITFNVIGGQMSTSPSDPYTASFSLTSLPTPEPASFLLMPIGLLAVFPLVRRTSSPISRVPLRSL